MSTSSKKKPISYVSRPSIKRLMKEYKELASETSPYFTARPVTEDNLLDWHFTIRGPPDSDYQDGIYHGAIIFPPDYPFKPPVIIFLTPNGRFETDKRICLSISDYHPEQWNASWSLRTLLLAIIGYFPIDAVGIGSIIHKPNARKALARESRTWRCPHCGIMENILPDISDPKSNIPDLTDVPDLFFHDIKSKKSSLPTTSTTQTQNQATNSIQSNILTKTPFSSVQMSTQDLSTLESELISKWSKCYSNPNWQNPSHMPVPTVSVQQENQNNLPAPNPLAQRIQQIFYDVLIFFLIFLIIIVQIL